MTFAVEFTPKAEEDLSRIDKTAAQIIADKITWLSQNIGSIAPAPLKGKFKGKYKLRAGDWRIVYSPEHTTRVITVYAIGHRREVYKL